MKNSLIILCMFLSLVGYTFGEYYSKRWAIEPGILASFYVIGAYIVAQAGWLPALRMHGQLSALTVIWSMAAIVCGVLVGVFAFGETLTQLQMAGMALALISMLMMF